MKLALSSLKLAGAGAGGGRATLAILAIAVIGLCGERVVVSTRHAEAQTHDRGATTSTAQATATTATAPRFETVRDELVARTGEAEVLADATPASWGRQTTAANMNLQLASLSGQWSYYAAAERWSQRAFDASRARWAGDDLRGPAASHAEIDFALHRFVNVSRGKDLKPLYAEAEASGNDELLAQAKALEGAARVALGEYEQGQALLREAVALDPDRTAHAQRLAVALVKTGDFTEALDIFSRAEAALLTGSAASASSSNGRARAWLALQRGLVEVERGRYSVARGHLERARGAFPGFWLVEEHLAELDVLEGRVKEAEAAFRALIERNADPEHMDALALLVRPADPAEADALIARARAIHVERLARFPEAAAGHALDHYLKIERDIPTAVTLAEKNLAIRPDGEARTKLAQAYLKAGRVSDARAEMNRVLATRWSSAESFATAAIVFHRAGDDSAAAAARTKALAQDPHAMTEIGWLVE